MASAESRTGTSLPNTLSPVIPLRYPTFPHKEIPKVRKSNPKRVDFDRQRFLPPAVFPKLVPYRKGRMGRIIMAEAA